MKSRIAALALAATIVCGSCSLSEDQQIREYTLPESFCGFGISQQEAEPLYPPGKTVEQREMRSYEDGNFTPLGDCAVFVDDHRVVFLSAVPSELGGGDDGLHGYLGYHSEEQYAADDAEQHTVGSQELTVWPDLAVSSVDCLSSTRDHAYLTLGLRLHWAEDDQDLSQELSTSIQPLMDEFLNRQAPGACETA
jgi:hypothetical protein